MKSQSKFYNKKNRLAYSIMEILIVVTVVGIIGAFAITSYDKAMTKQKSRKTRIILVTLHASIEIFKLRNSEFPDDGGTSFDLAELNSVLETSFMDDDSTFVYSRDASGPLLYSLQGQNTVDSNLYSYTITQAPLSSTNPTCTTTGSYCTH